MEKIPCVPSIGADIEAFVYDKETNKPVPCVGLLPGTKETPFPLDGLPEGYAVQEDNVMAEFNVPPATVRNNFVNSIIMAQKAVKKMLPKTYDLRFYPYATFAPKDLTSAQAQTIGCAPDFNAYTGGEVRMTPPDLGLHRGAGGHIHLGGNFQCPDFVAVLFAEAMIGFACNLRPSKGDKRALWYGQPGIYRPKPYGVEYRTPSCIWAEDADTMVFVAENALRCAQWLTNSDSTEIQSVFRKVKWTELRYYMNGPTVKGHVVQKDRIYHNLIEAGVQI